MRKILLGTFVALTLVALSGNPLAINPLASTPLIVEAYAESTQFIGSERGDTWEKQYFQDGDRVLVKHTLGKPEWLEHNGEYVPYIYEKVGNVHKYQSGQISFELNESTCDATIFEKGKISETSDVIIPSLAYKVQESLGQSGVWEESLINNESCVTQVTPTPEGLTFTTIKKEIETTQVDINNNGTLTNVTTELADFRVDWKTDGNGLETFITYTNNDPDKNSTHKFGFDEVMPFDGVVKDSIGNTISSSATTENIQEGIVFEKNGHELIYQNSQDTDLHIATNIGGGNVFNDYKNQNAVTPTGGKVTLDPTFSSVEDDQGQTYTTSTLASTCGTADAHAGSVDSIMLKPDSGINQRCYAGWAEFTISSIPTGVTITDSTLDYTVGSGTYALPTVNCDIVALDTGDFSTLSASDAWTELTTGTVITSHTDCQSTGAKTTDLGTSADADIESHLGDSKYSLGFIINDQLNRDSGTGHDYRMTSANTITLTVQYTTPIVPLAPTNDGVTNVGVDLQYDWTFGTNFNNATQPSIDNSTVYVGNTKYQYTPLANWNATQETDIGGITTSSNFEGLFHADSIDVSESITSEDDFSSDGWTDQDSAKMGVTGGTLFVDSERDSSNDASSKNIGTVCSSSCVFRFEFTPTANWDNNSGTGNLYLWVGLSDLPSTTNFDTLQDFFGFGFSNGNAFGTAEGYETITTNNEKPQSSLATGTIQPVTFSSGTTYYCQGVYDGTNMSTECFTGSDYSTGSLGKDSVTAEGTGHDEIKVGNIIGTTTTGVLEANIDNFKIYDGVSSLTNIILDYSGNDDHAEVTNLIAIDYEETFDTTGTWDLENSEVVITGGQLEITGNSANDNNSALYDLGGVVCSTSCILGGKIVLSSYTNTASGQAVTFDLGLSDSNTHSDYSTETLHGAMDAIELAVAAHASGSTSNWYVKGYTTSHDYVTGASGAEPLTETRYFDLIYDSTTTNELTLNLYTDADKTSLDESLVNDIDTTGLDDLQYIYARIYYQSVTDSNTVDVDDLSFCDNATSWNNCTGSVTLKSSSINNGFTNELQVTNAGLNVTSSNWGISGTNDWSINGIVTLNQTDPFSFLSFDTSGQEVLLRLDDQFIDLQKNAVTIFNHTLTTPLTQGNPQTVTITRDTSGNYETLINGTESVTSTDATTLGTVTNNLYHFGFDTSLANGGTWRLDELSVRSDEQTTQDSADFGERIQPFTFQASVNAPTTTYTHTGLAPQTDSCFKVTAWNSVGESTASGIECGTANDPSPTQPTGLLATDISELRIDLSWDTAPAYDNITGYRIFYESPIGNGWIKLVNDTGTSLVTYSHTSLSTKTQYNYMVAGINGTGVGSNSTASNTYTWGVPDDPTGFSIITPTVDTLTLNFTDSVPYGYSVTGYEVYRDNVLLVADIGNVTSYVDTGLASVTSYDYAVRALSSFGSSGWTNATGTTVTNPPTSLTVNDCYHTCTTQLNLEWVAPVPDTGVNGYKIEHESPIGNGWSTLVANTTTTTLYYNHTGLANDGVFHNYRIYALTPQGASEVSNTYAYSTHKLPDSITDLVVTDDGLLQFVLNWGIPSNLHGTLEGYMINYTTPAGDPLTIEEDNTESTSTTYTKAGNDPTVEYSFRVSAVTNHGTNSTFGNIFNYTLTTPLEVGDLTFSTPDNTNVVPYSYMVIPVSNTTDTVRVTFDSSFTTDCTIDQTISGTTNSYTGLSETSGSGSSVYHDFSVQNTGNDILEFDCWDQTDPTQNGQFVFTVDQTGLGSTAMPLVAQVQNFTGGIYGTEGEFGEFDLITLFVIILSMLGFNRKHPALGVGFMVVALGATRYYGLIGDVSLAVGGMALIAVLAIGVGLKKF